MPQVYQSSRDIPPGSSVDSEGRVFRIGTQEQIGILPQTVREAERVVPITAEINQPPSLGSVRDSSNAATPTGLPPLTQFSLPTIPTPQAPPFDLRPVPVLSSEPARQEALDLRTSLADLSSQATRAFETGEAERQTFEARRQAASEQALKTQQEQLRATAEEQISEREQLGRNRLRAFEATAASLGATRTSAALLDLGAIERENQRDIQGIQRDLNLALSQAQQAALDRDLQGARVNMQQAQALRDQLFARQQQAFENRASIEKLEDQRQAEDFARKQAVANFELNTREFEDKQVQQVFNNAMVQANFELEQLRAQQGTQRLNVEQIQQVYDNRLKQAQFNLQTQQQAVELGLKTAAEQRLEVQLQQTGIDKATDNARQAITTVLNTFGGADLKNIPQEMKDQFEPTEVQAKLPAGFITQGLETLKEKATEQQKQLAEEKLKDKNTQDDIMNQIRLANLGLRTPTNVTVNIPGLGSIKGSKALSGGGGNALEAVDIQGEIVNVLNDLNTGNLNSLDQVSSDLKPFIKLTKTFDNNISSPNFGQEKTYYSLIKPSEKQLEAIAKARKTIHKEAVTTPIIESVGLDQHKVRALVTEALKTDSTETVINDLINVFGYQKDAAERLILAITRRLKQ